MTPTLKISLIQFQPKLLSPEANFTTASAKIRDAAAAGCHLAVLPEYYLAVLPEYYLTSWVPSDPGFAASYLEAESYLPRYQALAKDLNIHIVPGIIRISTMGQAYTVPADACPGHVNCTVIFGENDEILRVGDIGPGDFVGDPDFAGAGVIRAFFGLAIMMNIIFRQLLEVGSKSWYY